MSARTGSNREQRIEGSWEERRLLDFCRFHDFHTDDVRRALLAHDVGDGLAVIALLETKIVLDGCPDLVRRAAAVPPSLRLLFQHGIDRGAQRGRVVRENANHHVESRTLRRVLAREIGTTTAEPLLE